MHQCGRCEDKNGKSRISFYNRHMFACVSFPEVKRKKETPPVYITLGPDRSPENPLPAVAVGTYSGRWTNRIVISDINQVDRQLIKRIKQTADFAAAK